MLVGYVKFFGGHAAGDPDAARRASSYGGVLGTQGSGADLRPRVHLAAPRLRERRVVAHRPRGDLERRRVVPPAAGPQRARHPRRHELDPRVPRAVDDAHGEVDARAPVRERGRRRSSPRRSSGIFGSTGPSDTSCSSSSSSRPWRSSGPAATPASTGSRSSPTTSRPTGTCLASSSSAGTASPSPTGSCVLGRRRARAHLGLRRRRHRPRLALRDRRVHGLHHGRPRDGRRTTGAATGRTGRAASSSTRSRRSTTFAVVLIFAIAKFTEGAWIVVVLGPLMYFGLIRLHRQYALEDKALRARAGRHHGDRRRCGATSSTCSSTTTTSPRRERSSTRARSTRPSCAPSTSTSTRGHPRARGDLGGASVRGTSPSRSSSAPTAASSALRSSSPPRPPARSTPSAPSCCRVAASRRGSSGCCTTGPPTRSPRRSRSCPARRATVIPFRLDVAKRRRFRARAGGAGDRARSPRGARRCSGRRPARGALRGTRRAVCDATWRERAKFSGRIRSVSVRKVDGTPTLECTLTDGSGSLLLVFQGRSQIPGIERGARLVVEGTVGLVAAQARDHQPRLRARRGPRVRATQRLASRSEAPASLSTPKTRPDRSRPRRTTDVARGAAPIQRGTDLDERAPPFRRRRRLPELHAVHPGTA